MKSFYTLPLLAVVSAAEYTPDFVTKSEAEVEQFTSYDSVSDCFDGDHSHELFGCLSCSVLICSCWLDLHCSC